MLQIAEGMNYLLMGSKIMKGWAFLDSITFELHHLGVATLKTKLHLSLLCACICG
jgi:hypothetical protein